MQPPSVTLSVSQAGYTIATRLRLQRLVKSCDGGDTVTTMLTRGSVASFTITAPCRDSAFVTGPNVGPGRTNATKSENIKNLGLTKKKEKKDRSRSPRWIRKSGNARYIYPICIPPCCFKYKRCILYLPTWKHCSMTKGMQQCQIICF